MRHYINHFFELCKSRIFVMLCGIFLLFFILVIRLFSLQIIHGEDYDESITASVSKTVNVPAPRGNIYDRYGRPLATNTVAYSVQIDDSITLDLTEYKEDLMVQLTNTLWAQGATPHDTLPISSSAPYTFTFEGKEREQRKAEKNWKESLGFPNDKKDASAQESLTYLFEKYNAPTNYTLAQKRAYVSYYISLSDKNLMALTLAEKLAEYGETLTDELPLSREYPYTLQFNENKTREKNWKESMAMKKEELQYDSLETLDYLRDFFGLPEGLPTDVVRNTLGIRYSLYLQRYQQYKSVTIATNISAKTLAFVEENQDIFPNVLVDTVSLREYPQSEYFSHLLGYIRQMTEADYALYKDDMDSTGNPIYTQTDIVGQTGIEKLYERQLNGTDGKVSIEVDNQGRRMSVIDSTEPIPGKDIFLTLDSQLQKIAYDSLEAELRKAVIVRLTSAGKRSASITDMFIAMTKANHISASKLMKATSGTQKQVYDRFLEANPDFSKEDEDALSRVQTYLLDSLSRGTFSSREALLVAMEQGTLATTPEDFAAIENGSIAPLTMVLNKLRSGEFDPSDTALDPSTGSVFITKVDSGEVLASVSYPSYDNNELVNNFNNAYYNNLLQDGNTPLVNRPLKQKKAPGSTFKMITALAGLETGAIGPNTYIRDLGLYKDAGTPYARCWIYSNTGGTHGSVDVAKALEVSCNYFFYEVAYRMGNAKEGNTNEGITTLNEYMAAFGLNALTGLELDEYAPTMASPYYKERTVKTFNPDATTSQTRWTDGDTIRAAIGQSVNSFTPAQVTKFISTLANGGTLYRLHLISHLQNPDGSLYYRVDETIENVTNFQEENLQKVYQGMYQVTTGARGTLRHSFRDFPVKVAAKTGTAEEDKTRSSHTWFVCFAPYEDPQIAITVMIPFGEGSGTPAPEVAKAIITEYLGLDYTPENTNLQTVLTQ
ncbi:penicillin-binding transpeptidase domain-containing protein [Anaerotignum sp. MB30-C6]|uniref:penicillin-binding transpeptidase domain-containing protein n=1 Tax=Anaerotignum sp. MB30-C6 TaxID=3070814 RepID=UPI0027DD90BE|nr:penicillin-binding transpeptidase domain-containing protein [Anaerotignum sp. MB30-C6]WMI81256.1 penicillin-binding transpeptidase domain-containing protein [Anaerotignum sp. MB30-C6]